MNRITWPLPLFYSRLREAMAKPGLLLNIPVGVSRWAGNVELLVQQAETPESMSLLFTYSDIFAVPASLPRDAAGMLAVGSVGIAGQAQGWLFPSPARVRPVHALHLAGPGMQTLALQAGAGEQWEDSAWGDDQSLVRWSRTIGALGVDAWKRLARLRIGIVGLGRTGSQLALLLGRIGAGRLTLVDHDLMEPHNLGESLCGGVADLTQPKVAAMARFLKEICPGPLDIVQVPGAVTRMDALEALKACDIIISCVDRDSARLAANAIAVLYCKPFLDIGTGIHGEGAGRDMGADIRLAQPGQCLLCFGGLRNVNEAFHTAQQPAGKGELAVPDWRAERSGSLASLNQCAAGVAMRIVEDFVGGRIKESLWVRLLFSGAGGFRAFEQPGMRLGGGAGCPLCRLAAMGDKGLVRMVGVLEG